jgi:hypothetical protein
MALTQMKPKYPSSAGMPLPPVLRGRRSRSDDRGLISSSLGETTDKQAERFTSFYFHEIGQIG